LFLKQKVISGIPQQDAILTADPSNSVIISLI